MAYMKKTIIAGKTIEVRKGYSARYGKKGLKRSENRLPTREAQKRVNERNALDNLTWKLNANFGVGDVHMVLGYGNRKAPTPEEARKNLDRFTRKARTWYKRETGKELRYISVTEYKRSRIHHHIILPEIPADVLYTLWPHGRPHITPLDPSGSYRALAEYLIKETAETFRTEEAPYKKRWNQSRNLKEPEITVEVVSAQNWRQDPKPIQGYYIDKDSIRAGVSETNGFPYQSYTMIQLEQRQTGSERRKDHDRQK